MALSEARGKLHHARVILQKTFGGRDTVATIQAMNILAELEREVHHHELMVLDTRVERIYRKVA